MGFLSSFSCYFSLVFSGFPEFMLFWYDWHFPVWVCFIASLTSYADVSASVQLLPHCGVFLYVFIFMFLFLCFYFYIIIIICLLLYSLPIFHLWLSLELFVVDAMSTIFLVSVCMIPSSFCSPLSTIHSQC